MRVFSFSPPKYELTIYSIQYYYFLFNHYFKKKAEKKGFAGFFFQKFACKPHYSFLKTDFILILTI